ncbi:MAG: TolC family protein [Puniceicoccales bacterium]|jgi:outer membrane protein TolC|nr:TolC family protein [Puniceicoccales bacterium]
MIKLRSRYNFAEIYLLAYLCLTACSHCILNENGTLNNLSPSTAFLPSVYNHESNFGVNVTDASGSETEAKILHQDDFLTEGISGTEQNSPVWNIYEVVDHALGHNPATRRMWARSRALAAQHGQARSALYPQVKIGTYAIKSQQPTVINGAVQRQRQAVFYPQLEIMYSLFHFGKDQASIESVKAALEASQHQYSRELQTIVYRAQCAYCKLDSAKASVQAEEQNLRDAERTQASVEKRYQAGLTNIQEDLQAKASTSQAQYRLEQIKSGVEAARAELSAIYGVPISQDVDVYPLPRGGSAWHETFSVIDSWMQRSIAEREDLVAMRKQLESRETALKAKEKALLPELIAGFTGSLRKIQHVDGAHSQCNAYVAIQWNLFDGFRNTYDVLEASQMKKIAEADLQEAQLNASKEIWIAYHAFRSSLRQLKAAEASETAAEKSFEATQTAYQNGLASFSDLVSSQNALATSRQQRVQSENSAYVALATLGYATGGIVIGETASSK